MNVGEKRRKKGEGRKRRKKEKKEREEGKRRKKEKKEREERKIVALKPWTDMGDSVLILKEKEKKEESKEGGKTEKCQWG